MWIKWRKCNFSRGLEMTFGSLKSHNSNYWSIIVISKLENTKFNRQKVMSDKLPDNPINDGNIFCLPVCQLRKKHFNRVICRLKVSCCRLASIWSSRDCLVPTRNSIRNSKFWNFQEFLKMFEIPKSENFLHSVVIRETFNRVLVNDLESKWTIMRQRGRSWVKVNDLESKWTIINIKVDDH